MTPDQLRQQLAADGMSFTEFRSSLSDELAIQRLRQRFAQSSIVVTDAELDSALASQAGGTQYQLANILVALPTARRRTICHRAGRTRRHGVLDPWMISRPRPCAIPTAQRG